MEACSAFCHLVELQRQRRACREATNFLESLDARPAADLVPTLCPEEGKNLSEQDALLA